MPSCINDYRISARRTAPEKVLVAMLGHPLGARQVTLPRVARPLGMFEGINVQDDPRYFGPIRTICVGIEQTEIRDEMLVVVSSQIVSLWSVVGYGRVER